MNTTYPDQLDIVKQAFQEWRDRRPKVSKIPIYLCEMVKPLLDKFPISMISYSLGLSHSQLKHNVIEQSVSFVEAILNLAKGVIMTRTQSIKEPTISTLAPELTHTIGLYLVLSV